MNFKPLFDNEGSSDEGTSDEGTSDNGSDNGSFDNRSDISEESQEYSEIVYSKLFKETFVGLDEKTKQLLFLHSDFSDLSYTVGNRRNISEISGEFQDLNKIDQFISIAEDAKRILEEYYLKRYGISIDKDPVILKKYAIQKLHENIYREINRMKFHRDPNDKSSGIIRLEDIGKLSEEEFQQMFSKKDSKKGSKN
jgi:hypothetical protein